MSERLTIFSPAGSGSKGTSSQITTRFTCMGFDDQIPLLQTPCPHPVTPKFFVQVKRNRTTPFWSPPLRVPLDAEPEDSHPGDIPGGTESQIQADGDDDDEEVEDMILGGNNGTYRECLADHIKTLRDFCESSSKTSERWSGIVPIGRKPPHRERGFNSTRHGRQ